MTSLHASVESGELIEDHLLPIAIECPASLATPRDISCPADASAFPVDEK